jgi:hypothetical protein
MKRRRTFSFVVGAACLGLGLLRVLAQLGTVGDPVGRVSGSYQGTSGTIRYGNAYVSQNVMLQQRSLPSENRGQRWADGYLPSENRYNYLKYGGLPQSGGRYIRPPQDTIRYTPAYTPPQPSQTAFGSAGSIRYGSSSTTPYRPPVSPYAKTSADFSSRTTPYSSHGSSSFAGGTRSYGTAGSVRYGSSGYGCYGRK